MILSFFCKQNPSHSQKQQEPTKMVSSCFTTFFLLICVFFFFFFFSEAQTAAIDEVLVVPEKYGILGSARISSDVKKEVDDARVSSINLKAREFRSRKMKLITRKALDGDRNVVEELNTSATTTGEYQKLDGVVGNTHHRENNKMEVWNDHHHHHHVVAHNLKMRSRGSRRNRGFVTFSADYHIPKPHPPRNN